MSFQSFKQLCDAVSKGNAKEVDFLLKVQMVNPNVCTGAPRLPLGIACSNVNLDIVRLLLKNEVHPANPNQQDSCGNTPFIDAVHTGNIELIELLINECLVKFHLDHVSYTRDDKQIISPLTEAVRLRNIPLVEVLIEAGANPTFRPLLMCHTTFPFYQAIHQGNVDMCKVLIKHGCDPNIVFDEEDCYMAVHVAAECGKRQIMQLLVDEGANIMLRKEILFYMFKKDNAKILQYFLQCNYSSYCDKLRSWSRDFVKAAIYSNAPNCAGVILRWGFYTCSQSSAQTSTSDFHAAATHRQIQTIKLLVAFNPMCLQESWLVNGKIPSALAKNEKRLTRELRTARKHPPRLDILCRTKIIQQMGYNPLQKAEKLQLPRTLRDFVQFKV